MIQIQYAAFRNAEYNGVFRPAPKGKMIIVPKLHFSGYRYRMTVGIHIDMGIARAIGKKNMTAGQRNIISQL